MRSAGDEPPRYTGEIAPTFGNGSCQKILPHRRKKVGRKSLDLKPRRDYSLPMPKPRKGDVFPERPGGGMGRPDRAE